MHLAARNPVTWFSVHFGVSATAAVRFRCPCCGYKTLEAPGALKLCPVCWWEDDGQEDNDAADVRLTVNGELSLREARANYAQCGAAHPRFLPYVRKPELAEQ
ncbi:MAG TPA: CPCC family cysteine-rich protein [Terracidiphilus sp.]|nr:CPCC family cysteine-rich protein [Terracidiphilus sp.]